MASMTIDVTIEIRTRGAQRWLAYVARPLRYVVGLRLAMAVGVWGACRLARYRVAGGKWTRFAHEDVC